MVYFIGAGPGDPELLTIKAKKVIDCSDVIIYAGSLVNPQVFADAKPGAKVYNSAGMTLEQVIAVMEESENKGLTTARIHTGDPAVFGAHREQMDRLDVLGIAYEVIPGVSSFFAAAAALKKEYTLPGVSQTVILTRTEGRTPMPSREKLKELASHRATMVIFLSAGKIKEVCEELMEEYPEQTPAAMVYKASWEDQQILCSDLAHLADQAEVTRIKKTALILVGDFLGDCYELSKLYDKHFSHEYRSAE